MRTYGLHVLERTRALWERQQRLVGDRRPLFSAVAEAIDATNVLYPGSYVDLTPAFIWPVSTYVDIDRRANQFFTDVEGIKTLLAEAGAAGHTVHFIAGDYREPLALAERSFDLLISLYAGFVSESCTPYLRLGGFLLVNSSHGDAAMASIDPRYRLFAVVGQRDGVCRVRTTELSAYLVPQRDIEVTKDLLHETGRGVAYTRSPFAYLFQRVT